MKLFVASTLVLLSACGVAQKERNGSVLSSTAEDRIASAVAGCYEVQSSKIEKSSNANDPLIAKVLGANELCLKDSLTGSGVSRSGRVIATVKDSSGELVGGAWGFDISEAQPRCPGCYMLSGFDGTLSWNGERRFQDKKAPIEVTMDINSLQTTYKFSLGQKAK